MARYLILAHQTAASPELRANVSRLAREDPDATFTLVVPATPVKHLPRWTGGSAFEVAQARLETAGTALTGAGARIERAIVGAASPLVALEDEFREDQRYDGLIISTFAPGFSHWLRIDIVSQAKRRFDLPVIHIIAEISPSPARPGDVPAPTMERVGTLLAEIQSPEGPVRRMARLMLTEYGRGVVPRIIELTRHSDPNVRWEAARLLVDVRDERAIPALIDIMEDESYGVRWLAAEGLVNIGQACLLPLLRRALEQPSSEWLVPGLRHVCQALAHEDGGPDLGPLVSALSRGAASVDWLVEIDRALRVIEGRKVAQHA